jgi:hypothetical protein
VVAFSSSKHNCGFGQSYVTLRSFHVHGLYNRCDERLQDGVIPVEQNDAAFKPRHVQQTFEQVGHLVSGAFHHDQVGFPFFRLFSQQVQARLDIGQ